MPNDRPSIGSYDKRKGSIYRKGGIYDQFGPKPPVFDPRPRPMAGIVEAAADQPGSALPFVGQVAGGYAGPVGGVAGALAGEAVRQGAGKVFGVQDDTSLQQFKKAGENAVFGEVLGYGAGKAIQKGTEILVPSAKKAGIRIAKNIIRPTGRLAKRSDILAKAALDEGVLSSSPQSMVNKIKAKSSALQNEIDSIIENYEGGTVNAEGAFRRMDALARKYRQLGAFQDADKVLQIKNQIIEGGNFRQPIFGEKETGQFVMGPASKQVNPKITSVKGSKINNANVEPTYDPNKGEYINEIVTPKKFIESPEDIIALHSPGKGTTPRKITSVSPKETYALRGETFGPSKKETVVIGTKPKEMTLKEANKRKREEYRYLEGKRAGGGWMSDTSTPEIAGRQEFAGGFRREIARKLPIVDTLNRRFGNLIDLGKSVEGRANVGTRNDIMSLGDIILGAESLDNPKALLALFGKKAWQGGKGAVAKGLYNLPRGGESVGKTISNPSVRALLSRLYEANQN